MKCLKMITAIFLISVVNVGCASASGGNYYEAVQKAAEAKAKVSEARYRALAQVASSGDGQAASAAVMAIALSNEDTIVPQYVESSALKWAQVLTPTIGTLGLGIVQANVAKNAANKAAEVQMASMQANADIQLGQQTMISNMGGQWADVAATGGQATVTLGLAGLDTADSIATAGFATATVGMNNLNEMGQFGMTTVGTVGMYGIDAAETLGIQGMLGIHETNEDWLTYTASSDTNFAQILADFNATIKQFGTDLGTPITCNNDGNGVFNCQ